MARSGQMWGSKFRMIRSVMSNQYRLLELGNSELLAGLSELVRQSNVLTAQLLAHLVELEERMLHLELGYSSLFAYCVEALAMSEGTAGRRVAAARVCRRFPDAFARLARGELHLCALRALASHLNQENAAELFEACRGKTRRQIEELLAVQRRFGIGARPRRAEGEKRPERSPERGTPPGGAVSPGVTEATKREGRAVAAGERGRYLGVAVRREAHGRDRGQCAFVAANGRRCNERAFLEFDHIEPFARLGAPDARNIRLLCKAHNLLHARKCFGTLHIVAKIAARQRCRSGDNRGQSSLSSAPQL